MRTTSSSSWIDSLRRAGNGLSRRATVARDAERVAGDIRKLLLPDSSARAPGVVHTRGRPGTAPGSVLPLAPPSPGGGGRYPQEKSTRADRLMQPCLQSDALVSPGAWRTPTRKGGGTSRQPPAHQPHAFPHASAALCPGQQQSGKKV